MHRFEPPALALRFVFHVKCLKPPVNLGGQAGRARRTHLVLLDEKVVMGHGVPGGAEAVVADGEAEPHHGVVRGPCDLVFGQFLAGQVRDVLALVQESDDGGGSEAVHHLDQVVDIVPEETSRGGQDEEVFFAWFGFVCEQRGGVFGVDFGLRHEFEERSRRFQDAGGAIGFEGDRDASLRGDEADVAYRGLAPVLRHFAEVQAQRAAFPRPDERQVPDVFRVEAAGGLDGRFQFTCSPRVGFQAAFDAASVGLVQGHVLGQRAVRQVPDQVFLVLVHRSGQVQQRARIGGHRHHPSVVEAQAAGEIILTGGVAGVKRLNRQDVQPLDDAALHVCRETRHRAGGFSARRDLFVHAAGELEDFGAECFTVVAQRVSPPEMPAVLERLQQGVRYGEILGRSRGAACHAEHVNGCPAGEQGVRLTPCDPLDVRPGPLVAGNREGGAEVLQGPDAAQREVAAEVGPRGVRQEAVQQARLDRGRALDGLHPAGGLAACPEAQRRPRQAPEPDYRRRVHRQSLSPPCLSVWRVGRRRRFRTPTDDERKTR